MLFSASAPPPESDKLLSAAIVPLTDTATDVAFMEALLSRSGLRAFTVSDSNDLDPPSIFDMLLSTLLLMLFLARDTPMLKAPDFLPE